MRFYLDCEGSTLLTVDTPIRTYSKKNKIGTNEEIFFSLNTDAILSSRRLCMTSTSRSSRPHSSQDEPIVLPAQPVLPLGTTVAPPAVVKPLTPQSQSTEISMEDDVLLRLSAFQLQQPHVRLFSLTFLIISVFGHLIAL